MGLMFYGVTSRTKPTKAPAADHSKIFTVLMMHGVFWREFY